MNHRLVSILLSALALAAAWVEILCNDSLLNLLLYLPFYGYPMMLGMFLSVCSEKPKSQVLLAVGSVLYGIWYFAAMRGVFNVLHKTEEEFGYAAVLLNSVNYVLVGVYALPFMAAVWCAVGIFERRERPGFYKKEK